MSVPDELASAALAHEVAVGMRPAIEAAIAAGMTVDEFRALVADVYEEAAVEELARDLGGPVSPAVDNPGDDQRPSL